MRARTVGRADPRSRCWLVAGGRWPGAAAVDDSGVERQLDQHDQPRRPRQLTILVTNDDGYAAEGIDTVVEALRKLPERRGHGQSRRPTNQSGTGSKTHARRPLTATEQKTKSGYPATAVERLPRRLASPTRSPDVLDEPPDLVVSGINEGQNLGPIASISGTVGAAKAAAAAGIPALAASQGLGERASTTRPRPQSSSSGSPRHRDALVDGQAPRRSSSTSTCRRARPGSVRGPEAGAAEHATGNGHRAGRPTASRRRRSSPTTSRRSSPASRP